MMLQGLCCIVTGAGTRRGIGRATSLLCAAHGARVAVVDLEERDAAQTVAELAGPGHAAYGCDVRSRGSCEDLIGRVLDEFGRIDVLVNNAGISQPQRFLDIRDQDYDLVMDVNLRGTFHLSQCLVPHLKAAKRGSIVNIASVAGQRGGGFYGGAHYSASKAAILGLTKAMARELGPDGIRVNAVCPGLIDTDITKGGIPPERRAMLLAGTPLGRAGTADEVAGACLFLASDLSAYVTGAEIDVNGGSHIH